MFELFNHYLQETISLIIRNVEVIITDTWYIILQGVVYYNYWQGKTCVRCWVISYHLVLLLNTVTVQLLNTLSLHYHHFYYNLVYLRLKRSQLLEQKTDKDLLFLIYFCYHNWFLYTIVYYMYLYYSNTIRP